MRCGKLLILSSLFCLATQANLYGQAIVADLEDAFNDQFLEFSMTLPDYPTGAQVDAHQGDSLVLVTLYNSTGGPTSWINRDGWLQGPVADWHGISLDGSGRVKGIDLRGNRLAGSLPLELGALAHLEYLNLDQAQLDGVWIRNEVSGAIPPELGQLTELKQLILSCNQLTGTIPPALGMLTNLTYLGLSCNRLTGTIPPALGMLTNLTYLSLVDNQLTGTVPLELSRLTQLQVLRLHANELEGEIPPELGLLTNLTVLLLNQNNLTGLIPPELGELTALRWLWLQNNDLTGVIPEQLGKLIELRILYLGTNSFADSFPIALTQLPKLEQLGMVGIGFSGPIPPELGRLTTLKGLSLGGNNFSGSIPLELTQLSVLNRLSLLSNDLSGPIPPELGELHQLEALLLNHNNLNGSIPRELGQLTMLRQLWLHDNDLSGSIPSELGTLRQLEELHLYGNGLSGSLPPQLGQLQNLREIKLSDNRLSGTIPPEFGQLESLRNLHLNHNKLSGPVPDWTGLSGLNLVNLQSNQFLFADLLPNADLSRLDFFVYAPQDSIDTQLTCTASGYVFTTPATAESNEYQWYRNGQSIPGEVSDTLRLTTASELDDYHATITNEALPRLALVSHRASIRGAAPCANVQYASVADSTLLVDFYNRTHGSLLWHNHTGWLEDPVVQWYGITLDASGRVTGINLPNNNLVGQLPLSRLDQLAHLRYLNVSGNQFSGTIPEELGDLTQLEYLVLSHNKLAGTIPRELADQAPLKVLDISGNQLAGEIPTELNQIATLQTFSVSANQLSGPVPDFTGLDQLDSLHVAQNEFFFMDLLPNASLTRLDDFVYAPQDSIDTFLSRTALGFAFTTAAKAMGNRYQWYRDDQPISGPQSDTLHVSANSDPAQYHAKVTNDRLPALTLVSRKRGVHDGLTLTEAELPNDFLLHQSYPNPFAELTTVTFELATPEHVRIVVYDLLGQEVATIADGPFAAGVHRIEFTGNHLASGQYLYRMEAGAYQATRFMSVVR